MKNIKIYFELFVTFLKISAFTIGGGLAMIPLLKSEIVKKKNWVNEEELTDVITMAQIVPGLAYVSIGASIGYRVCGILGAIISVVAVLIPSAVSIIMLAYFMKDYFENQIVKNIFIGIIAGVTAMTGVVAFNLLKKSVNSSLSITVFIVSFVLLEFFKMKVFIVVLFGILFGVIYSLRKNRREKLNG